MIKKNRKKKEGRTGETDKEQNWEEGCWQSRGEGYKGKLKKRIEHKNRMKEMANWGER